MKKVKTIRGIALTNLIGVLIIFSLLGASILDSARLTNTAEVASVNIEVYSDASCNTPLAHIDWGVIYPGSSVNETAYVKNGGNVPYTLTMNTSNWEPPAVANYMNVTWNLEGKTVSVNSTAIANIKLSLSSSVQNITNFSFDITIIGSD